MPEAVDPRLEGLGARGAATLLRRRARGEPPVRIVLAYHGVRRADEPAGLYPPKLDVETFRQHLDHLRRSYDVVPLGRIGEPADRGSAPRVALTFDDDLRGHLELAAPELAQRGLPATFFLTGSSLDGSEFREWWHDAEALSERSDGWRQARERLGRRWPWVGRASQRDFAATMVRLPPNLRGELASELRLLAGEGRGDPGLDATAVAKLAAAGFEVGFHTLRHHPLDTLDAEALDAAMREGREELESAAGAPLRSIAYPHGCADLRAAYAAEKAGFARGVGMGQDRAIRDSDSGFLLPRVDPYSGSLSAAAFAFRLARIAFGAGRR